MKDTRVTESDTEPDRAGLTSALPQHPIAVRVDAPGASRSSTEPQLSSGGGLELDGRTEDTGSPAWCRRRPSPDGQTERSGPLLRVTEPNQD